MAPGPARSRNSRSSSVDQLDLGARQVDAGGHDIHARHLGLDDRLGASDGLRSGPGRCRAVALGASMPTPVLALPCGSRSTIRTFAAGGQGGRQVDRGGGLADAALLVGDRDDPGRARLGRRTPSSRCCSGCTAMRHPPDDAGSFRRIVRSRCDVAENIPCFWGRSIPDRACAPLRKGMAPRPAGSRKGWQGQQTVQRRQGAGRDDVDRGRAHDRDPFSMRVSWTVTGRRRFRARPRAERPPCACRPRPDGPRRRRGSPEPGPEGRRRCRGPAIRGALGRPASRGQQAARSRGNGAARGPPGAARPTRLIARFQRSSRLGIDLKPCPCVSRETPVSSWNASRSSAGRSVRRRRAIPRPGAASGRSGASSAVGPAGVSCDVRSSATTPPASRRARAPRRPGSPGRAAARIWRTSLERPPTPRSPNPPAGASASSRRKARMSASCRSR